jgi:hypothetical protein
MNLFHDETTPSSTLLRRGPIGPIVCSIFLSPRAKPERQGPQAALEMGAILQRLRTVTLTEARRFVISFFGVRQGIAAFFFFFLFLNLPA